MQIASNVVTVLTGKALKADEIKVPAVEEHLAKTAPAVAASMPKSLERPTGLRSASPGIRGPRRAEVTGH